MGVRSKELGRLHLGSAALTTLYTCPAGRTTIVRSVTAFNSLPVGNTNWGIVLTRPAQPDVVVHYQTLGPNGAGAYERWTVLEPGDELQVFSTGATLVSETDFYASGAELDGVAP